MYRSLDTCTWAKYEYAGKPMAGLEEKDTQYKDEDVRRGNSARTKTGSIRQQKVQKGDKSREPVEEGEEEREEGISASERT